MFRTVRRLGDEIKSIKGRLKWLECEHTNVIFIDWFWCYGYGEKKCSDCGKRVWIYSDKTEFLKEKLAHESKLCADKIGEIKGEIQTLKKNAIGTPPS